MDVDVLADSLLAWLQTFESVTGARDTLGDLSDGIAMAEVFATISPAHLSPEKVSKFHRGVDDNPTLKLSNLKKLKRAVLDFYSSELGVGSHQLDVPEEAEVAEASPEAVMMMLELLLGCAVQCADKETHVQKLMMLEGEETKRNLMESIQKLLAVTAEAPEIALTAEEAAALRAEKDEAVFKLQQLEAEHKALLERHETIEEENTQLRSQAEARDSAPDESAASSEEMMQMKRQVTEAKDALLQERDEHAAILKEKSKEILDLKRQLETAQEEASQSLRLRDEVEELRQQATKVPGLERRLESYQRKLEEYSDLAKQAKSLEEQNSSHVKRILQLEDGESKVLKLEARVEKYKQQVDELENTMREEQRRSEKYRHEKAKYEEECQSLQSRLDEALSHHAGRESVGNLSLEHPSLGDSLGFAETSELREKIIRLEHENETLRRGSIDDQVEDLMSQKDKLASENRELRSNCAKLEADLEFARKTSASSGVKSTSDVAYEQLATVERDLKQAQEKLALAEAAKHQLAATQDELSKTQQELIALKKEHSLLGLDQKQMLEQVRSKTEQEFKQQLEDGMRDATEKIKALSQQLEAANKELAEASAQLADVQQKHAALAKEHEETEAKLKEKMEQVNLVLQQKDDVQSKLVEMTQQHNDRMLEQEKRFKETTAKMQEQMQQSSVTGGSQGASSEEVLKLKLQILEMEKTQVAQQAENERTYLGKQHELDRQCRDAEAKFKEAEAEVNRLKAKLQDKTQTLDKFKTELKRCMEINKELKKANPVGAASDEVVQALKQQKAELESKYEYEKQNREKLKQQHEREMRLMVTAWYDMSLQHQRMAVNGPERGTGGGAMSGAAGNSSFLSRQRHAVTSSQR